MSTMAVQQDTEPPLLTLPAELMEAVADNVSAADLRALKLTCRLVNTNVQRAFVRAHFTEQSFILSSPQSMQALVDITKDKVYGKVIRTLNLLALKIPKSPPYAQGRYGRRRAAEGQPDPDRDTRIQKPLREALQQIKTSTDGISINLINTTAELRSACGVRALESILGQADCLSEIGSYQSAIPTLLHAISEGGCPLVGFRFSDPRAIIIAGDWSQQHHPGLFNGLRTVDIGFRVGLNPIDLLAIRLGCADHLEHLIVRTGLWWQKYTDYSPVLETTAELSKLREVEIIGPYPEPRHLAAFCTRYGKTLKRLTLSGAPVHIHEQNQVRREQARTAVEKAWSAAGIKGIEFELS
ncbi:hypothetical protein LTR56_001621 [Elasticomyces elasticus]|nr:hypothetical protein LTR56_001621 [Elasticomyces elasticus]KAK3667327.1 hypothetical protein LTR22_001843 [Elasticomyces elasticus]KAK4932593.1 hypothetical protein LTR49_001017 [Elasticomyces elasticus]KAK5769615.1 hypothetical protein LTS12_000065 [Elasticomyces elasticus]